MKIIKVKGQDLSIPESWEETSILQWIELTKLLDNKYLNEEELNIDMLSILCTSTNYFKADKDITEGTFMDVFETAKEEISHLVSQIPIAVFNELMETTLNVFLVKAEGQDFDHFTIDGKDYAWINGYEKCTLNEVSTIKQALTIANKVDSSGKEGITRLLPIILRPAIEKLDAETGKTCWELETLDTTNLEFRRLLLLHRLSPVQVVNNVRFFFNGLTKLKKPTPRYSKRKTKVK
ncbi:MAG: hypothetical protein BGO69_15830 [Bacteroidetes bacterium 46-16]|nr:MAG: hypothetical protein BGO69_15830 [Bacteroidetes bacterium 46-16]